MERADASTLRPTAAPLRRRASLFLGVTLALALPPALAAQDVIRSFTYEVDLRQGEGAAEPLGIDFDLNYHLGTNVGTDPRGHHFGWDFQVRGFQNFKDNAADANFMAGQIKAAGVLYRPGQTPLPARTQARLLDLLERDAAGGGPGLTEDEVEELNGLVARITANRRFWTYDLHYRLETDQELDAKQHVLGAGIGGEVPLLHEVLDLVPRMTSARHPNYRTPPLRVWAGIEWVGGQDEVVIEGLELDGAYGRVRIEAAWSTLVLEDLVLRATYQGQILFARPGALVATNRGFNGFLEAWVTLPIGDRFGLAVKYIDGRPPPLYQTVSTAQLALTISVQ